MARIQTKDLSDQEILRIARSRLIETSANSYIEQQIDTQLSVERGVIWMINFIEFDFETLEFLDEVAAAAQEYIKAQITRESKDDIVNGDDSDLIQGSGFHVIRSAAIGTDAGPLSFFTNSRVRYDFPIPLPFASQSIYLGIKGSDATQKHAVSVRIGYTVRIVSDKFFFRVAQALIG